ncbi:hypothetical protein Tco_0832252 [Tanacetum coccineum]
MKDQLLPTDASPIALSPDYNSDSDPEEDDEEEPEEDPADYPADGGDNDDNESSDDDNDDVGLFKGLERVKSIAYKLKLPQELSRVHNTFHISNLKKCCSDDPLAIPLGRLHIDDKFHLVEEPVVIMEISHRSLVRGNDFSLVIVTPGSVMVPTGSVMVPTGSVMVPTGSVMVPTGSVIVSPGSTNRK